MFDDHAGDSEEVADLHQVDSISSDAARARCSRGRKRRECTPLLLDPARHGLRVTRLPISDSTE